MTARAGSCCLRASRLVLSAREPARVVCAQAGSPAQRRTFFWLLSIFRETGPQSVISDHGFEGSEQR